MLFKLITQALKGAPGPDRALFGKQAKTMSMSSGDLNDPTALNALLDHASTLACSDLDVSTAQRVNALAATFSKAVIPANASELNVFVYHVLMGDAGKLQYRDLAMDTTRYDYRAVMKAFVDSVSRWQPEARVYLISDLESQMRDMEGGNVKVVELEVSKDQPMYERVCAMCAYVHSAAFDADTLFLDSDAFLNKNMAPYLEGDYDIAVTVREIPGLMPVNEGVIVAKRARPERVRRFFRRYLATYEELLQDAHVQSYYGDIRKWRGGQLTLNAITRNAAPYSPYRDIIIDEAALRSLPCDPFNYSYDYKEGMVMDRLKDKVIIHLKGGRKASLEAWQAFTQRRNGDSSAPGAYVAPLFALWNKEYRTPPFQSEDTRQAFVGALRSAAAITGANQPGSGALMGDDLFVWFRNVSFLSDPAFIEAMGPLREDQTLRARIWRVYMLCWAARSCLSLEGDYVDLGCYDGKTVSVIERYCRFRARQDKRYWLYDLFENPPEESKKAGHGPALYDFVLQQFEPLGNFHVIKGPVPDSFLQGLPEKIAFAQIDLNAAEPEVACLEVIYDRIVPGGIIIFDDYGFRRYRESHVKESAFLAARGQFVWESPTGQGLLIKR